MVTYMPNTKETKYLSLMSDLFLFLTVIMILSYENQASSELIYTL